MAEEALARSICIIWLIFTSSIIQLRRSAMRAWISYFRSLYLTYVALAIEVPAATKRRRRRRHAATAAPPICVAISSWSSVDERSEGNSNAMIQTDSVDEVA